MQKVQALLRHSTHQHCRKQIIALTGSKNEMQEAQTKALLPVNYSTSLRETRQEWQASILFSPLMKEKHRAGECQDFQMS